MHLYIFWKCFHALFARSKTRFSSQNNQWKGYKIYEDYYFFVWGAVWPLIKLTAFTNVIIIEFRPMK